MLVSSHPVEPRAENRPFFQEGSEYLDSAIFTSQLIPQFDVGVNTYGKLNDKTQFGFLNTVDFGRDTASVANLTYAPNTNDNYRFTVARRDLGGTQNTAYLARYNRQLGPWSIFFRDMGSDDSNLGFGRNSNFTMSYFQGGLYGNVSYSRVEPNYAPSLGFVPERNYHGPSASLYYDRPLAKGPLQSYSVNLSALNYSRLDGSPYRRAVRGSYGLVSRNGIWFGGNIDRPVFEGSRDRIDSVGLSFPVTDPYRNAYVNYTWGEISQQNYRLLSFGGAYRFFNRLQLTGSVQKYKLGAEETEQTIFGGNYDLGNDRSISGRLVQTGSNTNWYAAFRRSGNRGAEYYLILGDPSALRYRPSLILKVVVPFRV